MDLIEQCPLPNSPRSGEGSPSTGDLVSGCNLTFLVHSEHSGSDRTPSSSFTSNDKFAHTRTKRKRTSPEDFAILEAEYLKNPRPDKASRAGIVERVSLSDKEVQVWFQNRRQMTRRKHRTWQPNAITSIIRSSYHDTPRTTASPDTSFEEPAQGNCTSESSPAQKEGPVKRTQVTTPLGAGDEATPEDLSMRQVTEDKPLPRLTMGEQFSLESLLGREYVASKQSGDETGPKALDPVDQACVTKALEDSISPSISGFIMSQETTKSSGASETAKLRLVKKEKSVRLTMSQEGLAGVILKSDTPSPQKPLSQPLSVDVVSSSQEPKSVPASSQSDVPSAEPLQASSGRRTHGRSQDARTWEFYCDSDARNALTTAAEHERKGSALGALSLIRSNSSGRKTLLPPKKPNLQQTKDELSKRKDNSALEKKKPKLARTSSSYARLQNTDKVGLSEVSINKGKSGGAIAIWEDPDGDSDKENWEPGTQISRPRYRRFGDPDRGSAILQENTRELSQSSSLGAMVERERARKTPKARAVVRTPAPDKENSPVDKEVSQFMGESTYDGGEDDIDAVQSLLSLSQGIWK